MPPSALQNKALLGVLLPVVFYMSVGPALIIVNRSLIKEVGFDFPILISAAGQGLSGLCSRILIDVLGVVALDDNTREMVSERSFILTALVPVGACQAITLACGNAVYLYLNMGFIQVILACVYPMFTWI
jgi:hypothetical protein